MAVSPIPPPTPEQIAIVKSTAPVLEEHGVTITTAFYKNLHNDIPSLGEVFNQANQSNGHQARALAMSVLAYAKYIDNLAVLADTVELICQKHASLLIQPEQYAVVGTYLLAAIKQILGDAATEDIISAWAAAYWQLATLFINREAEIYSEKSHPDWREFTVNRMVKECDEVTSFYLTPKDGKPIEIHKPGQYVSVRVAVPQQDWRQSRQYSLSESHKDYYRISVKRIDGINVNDPSQQAYPGWVSNVLHDKFNEGDTVDVTFPCGSFFLDEAQTPEAPIVLISGGVGFTPLMAMLDTLVDSGSQRPVTWIHATRSESAYAFGDHIKRVMKEKKDWHAKVYNRELKLNGDEENYQVIGGRLDLDAMDKEQDLYLNNPDTQYFICGPDAFMVELKEKLVALGATEKNVKYERFGTGDVEKKAKAPVKEAATCPFSGKAAVSDQVMGCPFASKQRPNSLAGRP